MIQIAQSIAGSSIFKTYESDDFAGVSFRNFLPLVGVHLKNTRNPFFFVFSAVENVATRLHSTAVNAEVSEFAYERVSDDFERQTAERFVVVSVSFDFLFFVFRVEADNVVDVNR